MTYEETAIHSDSELTHAHNLLHVRDLAEATRSEAKGELNDAKAFLNKKLAQHALGGMSIDAMLEEFDAAA